MDIDFAFSEDGDILLGAPKLDTNGNLLYLHADRTIDVEQYQNGVQGKTIQDMAYSLGRDALRQVIINRLKTDAPDWFHYPTMGGNLTDLIGEPNTKDTGQRGVVMITEVLTYGNLLDAANLSIRAVPVNSEDILFLITVKTKDNDVFKLPIVFNLNHGLKEV
jgi:hypothetical protein